MSKIHGAVKWPVRSPAHQAARRLTATLLRRAIGALTRWAGVLALETDKEAHDQVVEFHAEAGAPEGALYVDGRLVGWIAGVRRL